MVVGALLGFLVVLIITPLFPVDPLVGLPALIGYFSLYGITIGVVLGAVVGVVLDRRSRLSARTLEAEREVVDAAPTASTPPEGELDD